MPMPIITQPNIVSLSLRKFISKKFDSTQNYLSK